MTSQKLVRLSDVCQQDRTSVKAGQRAELAYRGLESIESNTGRYNEAGLSKTPEVPLANSFRFGPEHVLYGKLRPYLNKVALAEFEGKCSTEIIPLLPSPDLDRRFLAYFLRSPRTVSRISEKTAGARMPRADMDFIFSLELVLPSLTEQRRIVDLLSRAEGIVRLRRDAQRKAAELIPAIFVNMFGDPATNPKGWPKARFGEYLRIQSSVRAPDIEREGDVPCVGADSIESGTGQIVSWPTVADVQPISGKYGFCLGDVLYSKIRPALRKVVIAPSDGYCSADMYPLRVGEVATREYVHALLLSNAFTEHAVGVSMRAQMPKVNRETLFAYSHPLPPIALQRVFSERAKEIFALQEGQHHALGVAKAAFGALLSKAI